MDFGNPSLIFSGLLIGLIGFVMFNYGRKQLNFRILAAGLTLCVYPYFISSMILLWLIFALIIGGIWALNRWF
jgi:hypothetical protein